MIYVATGVSTASGSDRVNLMGTFLQVSLLDGNEKLDVPQCGTTSTSRLPT